MNMCSQLMNLSSQAVNIKFIGKKKFFLQKGKEKLSLRGKVKCQIKFGILLKDSYLCSKIQKSLKIWTIIRRIVLTKRIKV